ncbi:MAG: Rieske (2Fe-2S) protein [Pirellulaceae bacterium]
MAFVRVCQLEELPDPGGREFMVSGRVVAIFRHGSQVHAVDGMCAHQGGPLAAGMLDGNCITCPWHGWQYDVRDGKNMLTGKQMLDCFAIDVRDGEVWIEV